jgi:hypothetical protein
VGWAAGLRVFVDSVGFVGDGNRDFIDPTNSGRASLVLHHVLTVRHVDSCRREARLTTTLSFRNLKLEHVACWCIRTKVYWRYIGSPNS